MYSVIKLSHFIDLHHIYSRPQYLLTSWTCIYIPWKNQLPLTVVLKSVHETEQFYRNQNHTNIGSVRQICERQRKQETLKMKKDLTQIVKLFTETVCLASYWFSHSLDTRGVLELTMFIQTFWLYIPYNSTINMSCVIGAERLREVFAHKKERKKWTDEDGVVSNLHNTSACMRHVINVSHAGSFWTNQSRWIDGADQRTAQTHTLHLV